MKQGQGRLFIISGPSGVGKTTIVKKFLQQCGECCNVDRAVTYTTKQPRGIEENGQDYHFISQDEFKKKIQEGFFLEWSDAYGAFYGTQKSILQDIDKGNSLILVIDRDGAKQILSLYSQAVLVWITVSSVKVICERLSNRDTESFQQIEKRMKQAYREIAEENQNPIYHYYINNDYLKDAVEQLFNVISPFCKQQKFVQE